MNLNQTNADQKIRQIDKNWKERCQVPTTKKRIDDIETVISRIRPIGRPLTFFEDSLQPGWFRLGVKSSDHLSNMNYDLSEELFTEDEVKKYIDQNGGDHIAVIFQKMDTLGEVH